MPTVIGINTMLAFQEIAWIQLARWIVMFLIGVFTGLIASVIDISIRELTSVKYKAVKKSILL